MSFWSACLIFLLLMYVFVTLETVHAETVDKGSAASDTKKEGTKSQTSEKFTIECKDDTDQQCVNDQESLRAIQGIHGLIDDDHSGEVDQTESDEFFREELQTDDVGRQSIFHGNDKLINVKDLWQSWKKSKVYNWTVDDVIDWLVNSVELPQYTSMFQTKNISGPHLPRIAISDSKFMSAVLGITNVVHKKKLELKAMDVVLFGEPKKGHSLAKDIALVASLVIALGGCWFAYIQHKYSQSHVKKMMQDLESLQKAESSLQSLETELHKAEEEKQVAFIEKSKLEQRYKGEIETALKEVEESKTARECSSMEDKQRIKLAEEEIETLRAALCRAEKELENYSEWRAPKDLQLWLQYTYEVEQMHFQTKQQAAQRQFGSAKEACEKMRRKRGGMLGTLRIAQGNSIDEIDQRILQARMALEEIRSDLQERQERWANIEGLCNFAIRSNAGRETIEKILYGENAKGNLSNLVAPMNLDDADEDVPPAFPKATDVSQSTLSIPVGLIERRLHSSGSQTSLNSQMSSRSQVAGHVRKGSADLLTSKQVSPSAGSNGVSFHLGDSAQSPSSPDKPPGYETLMINSTTFAEPRSRIPKSTSYNVAISQNMLKNTNNNSVSHRNNPVVSVGQPRPPPRSLSDLSFQKQTRIISNSLSSAGSPVSDEDRISESDSAGSNGDKKKRKKPKLKMFKNFFRNGTMDRPKTS